MLISHTVNNDPLKILQPHVIGRQGRVVGVALGPELQSASSMTFPLRAEMTADVAKAI